MGIPNKQIDIIKIFTFSVFFLLVNSNTNKMHFIFIIINKLYLIK